jgi:diguanylate cyclase (GGDEF)-like protein
VSTMVVFALFGFVLGRQADELQRRLSTDPLTGLLDRRAFLAELDRENVRSRRYAQPLAVAVLDVDGLKTINDRGGHGAGDAALRAIGDAVRDGLRASDLGGRVGGDEFAVLAPESDEHAAVSLAERIRARAEAVRLPGALPLTVSIGLACVAPGRSWTADGILSRADRALYEAKRLGRNRVVLDHPETEVSS